MRRMISLILLLVMINVGLTSCKIPDMGNKQAQRENTAVSENQDEAMDKGPVRGGTLNFFSTNPDTLNPILTNNMYVQDFSTLMFESLVKLDKKQKPVPVLSDKWEVSDDGLTWTFHIRENVLWHDNIPLTAEDVEFTLQTILNATIESVYKKNLQNIVTFSAVDRNNFRIILQKPYSFMAELMTFPILPKHYFEGEDMLKTSRNMVPVGTGPYKFQSYKEKSYVKLIANDKWWNLKNADKSLPDLPYVAEIQIKIYESAREAINAFQTRDTDVAFVDFAQCAKYSGRSDLAIKKYAGRNYEFLAFNLSRPATGDKAVRQAMSYAIDKFKIISDVLSGEAIAADIPVIPDTWLYDTNIVSYTPDVEKAKNILLENGWKEQNGAMYKIINGGYTPLSLELLVNEDDELRCKVADEISKQVKEIGINLQVKKLDWDGEFKQINARQFDMVFLGYSVSSIPDISFAYSSAEIATGRNVAGYSNLNVDGYLERILSENDSSKKKALFLNMKQIITDDEPCIGLYFYNNATFYNKRIRGDLNPYIFDQLNDLTKWYIPIR